jgi:uncharacterized protein (DUF2141 family)
MIAQALTMAAVIASNPSLGIAQGQCRPGEPGPAFEVTVEGLMDRSGQLRLELYPANDADFLADDNLLIAAGKPFARVVAAVPPQGPAMLCIRAPRPGRYALSLLHDRNADHRFTLSSDGIGFAGNPRLGWSKPKADKASATVGQDLARIAIRLNYRRGLGMRPLEAP